MRPAVAVCPLPMPRVRTGVDSAPRSPLTVEVSELSAEFAMLSPDDGNGYDVTTKELEKGMSQLYVQVQDVEHKIIYPYEIKESTLKPAPWWT